MSSNIYHKALRLAQKEQKSDIENELTGVLPVLDEHTSLSAIAYRESLGIIDIPMEQIVGTVTASRSRAFSTGFYPLMDENSEFAAKWATLCQAHLREGIREPIKAVEYLGKFYIVEGHKRVSVLKYFGASSISGNITRWVPVQTDQPEVLAYYEFLDFYRLTGIYYIQFSRTGGYAELTAAVGKKPNEPWSADELHNFHSVYMLFRNAYLRHYKIHTHISEALLVYLDIFGYQKILHKLPNEMEKDLIKLRPEFQNRIDGAGFVVLLDDSSKKPLFHIPASHLTVAFLHDSNTSVSDWVHSHELGRRDAEAAMGEQMQTFSYMDINSPERAELAIESAVRSHANVIFTTSPSLLQASLSAAIQHPQIKFLNCSLGTVYPSVRTYYARTYEAKFLLGAAAGALTSSNEINYIADYPIYGIAADINAFALGVQLVNPRATVHLEWSQTTSKAAHGQLSRPDVTYIADIDRVSHAASVRQSGLYINHGDCNVALPLCRWGRIYTKILRRILDGSWKNDAQGSSAVNYWWGMDSGAVDVILSRRVPYSTHHLLSLLGNAIHAGTLTPFSGEIHTQSGELLHLNCSETPHALVEMNWLVENVRGSFPEYTELTEYAQSIVDRFGGRGVR